jgi:hypothetical protein
MLYTAPRMIVIGGDEKIEEIASYQAAYNALSTFSAETRPTAP